jgi:hypothetical protein
LRWPDLLTKPQLNLFLIATRKGNSTRDRAAVRARRCAHDEACHHLRHAAYGADASRRGTDASGEECAMPAWVHGEWRLLRALISHAAGSRSEAYALPKQIDAEGQ